MFRLFSEGGLLAVLLVVIEERPFVFFVLASGPAVNVHFARAKFEERGNDYAYDNRGAQQDADACVGLEQEVIYLAKIHVIYPIFNDSAAEAVVRFARRFLVALILARDFVIY